MPAYAGTMIFEDSSAYQFFNQAKMNQETTENPYEKCH